ncbi:MAG: diacylglycerol kinase, catalytic region [Marmoricola sp.]|nr:diacylglycerol kinase, catalytic region [Marmoricola sp.]
MRSFAFLVNPLSGGGAAPAAVVPVARLLRDAGADVEVTYSPGPGEVHELVAAAVARGDVVVAVGGDGMLSSVAGLVARAGGTLGIVAAGRGNDFARMLQLPQDPGSVATTLLEGVATPTDLVEVTLPGSGPRVVAGSVYAGVDARAGEIVDAVRWMPAQVQYPYAALHALATYVPCSVAVVVDGVERSFRAATVVVANSGFYGKGMHIAPDASVTDGLLDVVVIEAASRRELMRALPKVYDGAHVRLDAVTVLRGTSVALSGTPSVAVGGDGEPLGMLPTAAQEPMTVRVLPGALHVLT